MAKTSKAVEQAKNNGSKNPELTARVAKEKGVPVSTAPQSTASKLAAKAATVKRMAAEVTAKAPAEFDHSPKTEAEVAKQNAKTDAIMVAQHGTTEPVKVAVPKAKTPKKEPVADKRVITLLVKENPKRPGSKAHARFELYKNGMTVEQFLAAGGTLSDVAWNIAHKFIEVK